MIIKEEKIIWYSPTIRPQESTSLYQILIKSKQKNMNVDPMPCQYYSGHFVIEIPDKGLCAVDEGNILCWCYMPVGEVIFH